MKYLLCLFFLLPQLLSAQSTATHSLKVVSNDHCMDFVEVELIGKIPSEKDLIFNWKLESEDSVVYITTEPSKFSILQALPDDFTVSLQIRDYSYYNDSSVVTINLNPEYVHRDGCFSSTPTVTTYVTKTYDLFPERRWILSTEWVRIYEDGEQVGEWAVREVDDLIVVDEENSYAHQYSSTMFDVYVVFEDDIAHSIGLAFPGGCFLNFIIKQ